ncbi:hypothetical protein BC833DRAFT_553291 [Globomyces pollinis-pini]|nr:hypothetical protein BC833DRAFT_553291 [Globomyces pollinis-pini]
MSDRLTQLQQCVDKLSECFYISIGALQRDAPLVETNPEIPVTCWTKEQIDINWKGNQELAKTVAKDIVETAKVIDFLIENLPGINESEMDQMRQLEELELENKKAGEELENALKEGVELFDSLQHATRVIIDKQNNLVL